MTNSLRHGLGVVIGVVATPLVWLGMFWSANELFSTGARLAPVTTGGTVLPLFVMLVLAAILGLIAAAPFVSPVAAVITGAVNLLFGVAIPVLPSAMIRLMHWLPDGIGLRSTTPAFVGMYALVGVILLVSAAFPHRWRAAARRPSTAAPAARYPWPGQPPAGPPGAPYGVPQAGPQGTPQGAQGVPWGAPPAGPQGAPQAYGHGPGQGPQPGPWGAADAEAAEPGPPPGASEGGEPLRAPFEEPGR